MVRGSPGLKLHSHSESWVYRLYDAPNTYLHVAGTHHDFDSCSRSKWRRSLYITSAFTDISEVATMWNLRSHLINFGPEVASMTRLTAAIAGCSAKAR